MSLEDRIRRLEEKAGYLPAEIGISGIVPDGLYMAVPDPGKNYPLPPQANTFYAQMITRPAFSPIVGLQGFIPNADGPGEYCLNEGTLGYVLQGTIFPGFHFNGQLYCRLNGPCVFTGTTTQASLGPGVAVNVTGSQGGPWPLSTFFSMAGSFPIPINWPVQAIGNQANGAIIDWCLTLTQSGRLTTDIYPGGSGFAVLANPSGYGSVAVTDTMLKGGINGQFCQLTYGYLSVGGAAGWYLQDTSSCA